MSDTAVTLAKVATTSLPDWLGKTEVVNRQLTSMPAHVETVASARNRGHTGLIFVRAIEVSHPTQSAAIT